jgi:hypothetical protein
LKSKIEHNTEALLLVLKGDREARLEHPPPPYMSGGKGATKLEVCIL